MSNKTWEVMNALETEFNKIVAIEGMVDYIQDGIEKGDSECVKSGVDALKAFLPVFIDGYDKVSKRAWNHVVVPANIESLHDFDGYDYSDTLTNDNQQGQKTED